MSSRVVMILDLEGGTVFVPGATVGDSTSEASVSGSASQATVSAGRTDSIVSESSSESVVSGG